MTSQRNLPPLTAQAAGFVRVRGAREHNLRNVDVDIPRDALVVFTGVSGSGKSSLAFSTVYAEAQRRYFESVAPYARRLIDQVGVPDVDSIEGLPPAVALQQQRGTPSARSSVGSVTTLSSLIRMLYSRAGQYPAGQAMLYAEDFSPNLPQGACPQCHGLGRVYEVTEALMVPDPSLSIRQRAVASWPLAWQGQNLRDILVTLGYDVDIPWRDLPKRYGPVSTVHDRFRRWGNDGTWQRVLDALQARARKMDRIDFEFGAMDGSVVRAHKSAAGAQKRG